MRRDVHRERQASSLIQPPVCKPDRNGDCTKAACVGGLAFLTRVYASAGFLLWFLLAYACLTTASLCNTLIVFHSCN